MTTSELKEFDLEPIEHIGGIRPIDPLTGEKVEAVGVYTAEIVNQSVPDNIHAFLALEGLIGTRQADIVVEKKPDRVVVGIVEENPPKISRINSTELSKVTSAILSSLR